MLRSIPLLIDMIGKIGCSNLNSAWLWNGTYAQEHIRSIYISKDIASAPYPGENHAVLAADVVRV